MKITFLYYSILHWCAWMRNQILPEYHFESSLSALQVLVSWNLKITLENRATMVTKLPVCPCPQCTELATPSRGTAVSTVCKPLPFLWIRIHTGEQWESELWLSYSTWALSWPHGKETGRGHMELTQEGCWFQVKSTVPCWFNVLQPQHNKARVSQWCLSALTVSTFLRAETRVKPITCWSQLELWHWLNRISISP